jgi:hypothetical protein
MLLLLQAGAERASRAARPVDTPPKVVFWNV